MENKRGLLIYVVILISVVVGMVYPHLLGILLFVGLMFFANYQYRSAAKKEVPKQTSEFIKPVSSVVPDSHQNQASYSAAYSLKKVESHDAVKDAPLSEAERNVLYGK